MSEINKMPGVDFLMLITNLHDAAKVEQILQRSGLPLKYRCRGEGTASNEMMDVLGLTSNDKAITITLVPKYLRRKVITVITDELDLYRPGNGIIFSIPVSGISGGILNYVDHKTMEYIKNQMKDQMKEYMESGEAKTMENTLHSLVIAIVNRGFSEDVMDVAKQAGAVGGTVINGRRLGMEDVGKFWGISMQSEKEIVAILVPKENRMEVMKLIGENCGLQNEAQGIVLSLPVNDAAGLGNYMEYR